MFASVSYYSTDITGSLEMEVYDDGLIVLLHTDEDQDSFVFTDLKTKTLCLELLLPFFFF